MRIQKGHVVVWWLIVIVVITGSRLRRHWLPPKQLIADGPMISSVRNPVCLSYPFAIVSCGLHSMADLEAARSTDSKIRSHYADIGIVHPAILKSDEMSFVTYRQGS